MALRALVVGGVGLGRHLGILDFVDVMAVQANVRRWGAFFRIFEVTFAAGDEGGLVVDGMMMAVVAGDIIACVVLGMLKENAAGGTGIVDADGLVRGLGGKKGVTEKTYEKENASHA